MHERLLERYIKRELITHALDLIGHVLELLCVVLQDTKSPLHSLGAVCVGAHCSASECKDCWCPSKSRIPLTAVVANSCIETCNKMANILSVWYSSSIYILSSLSSRYTHVSVDSHPSAHGGVSRAQSGIWVPYVSYTYVVCASLLLLRLLAQARTLCL